MEHAVIVTPGGEERLVTITEMEEAGEDAARALTYLCPDEDCRIRVYPAFPEEIKGGRVKAPRPYFSARRPHSHLPSCRRDGLITLDEQMHAVLKMQTFSPQAEALLADYPIKFDESESGDTDRTSGGGIWENGTDSPEGRGVRWRSSGQPGQTTRYSVRGSRHLENFVRVYESLPGYVPLLPIKIAGCPAKTYAEAFMSVAAAFDAQGVSAARHIFYGDYKSHTSYDRSLEETTGTAIHFVGRSDDGKKLGVWIPKTIGPDTLRAKIFARLKSAQLDKNAKIYALGHFEPYSDWKHTITLVTLGHLWVSLPDDLQ